ncbi:MAG: glycine cleavage system protein GcvH [Kiritimatiellae bacterium]|nr:glycine cleavage system protein GcvH [Kiritimatiellia bacterium]
METPKDLKFTKTHEWVRVEGDTITVGITDFAQSQLSDVTYVELPEEGDHLHVNEEAGVVESVKAASDIYAPLSGTVTETNTEIMDSPEFINTDPYGTGWLFKMKLDDPADANQLMTADQYEEALPEESE